MISGEKELGRDRYRVGRVAKMFYKCFISKLCLFHVSLFGLFKYLVKTSMALKKYFNPIGGGGWGGGAQSNGFGLVLLCNSGKKVLAKTFDFTFGV